MKMIYICLAMLALSACVKVSNDDLNEDGGSSSPAEVTRTLEPQVIALADANRYQVQFPMHDEAQSVQRSIKNSDAEPVSLPMNLKDGVFIDAQPEANHDYVYEQGVVRNGNFEVLQTYQIHIPKDELISSEVVLSENTNWKNDGRFFMTPQGVITTNGYLLTIQTSQLIINQGKIRTFPEGTQAAVGQEGRSGGAIRITSQTGKGQLIVEMRGQRGGNGAAGPDYVSTNYGIGIGIAIGGPIGGGFIAASPGEKGKPGGNGFRGGNSGTFAIEFSHEHQLVVLPTVQAGLGGTGGPGGSGSPAVPNMNLEAGARGDSGREGAVGDREGSYINDLKGQRAL